MKPRVLVNEVKGDGPPIVLVPGGLTGWVSWTPLAETLSASRTTVRVQPIHNELGSAGERGDAGYTAAVERESLLMTLDALGVETADFAGWSAGGRALLEFALAHPGRVRTLTLVEPAAYWILDGLGESTPEVVRLNRFLHALAGQDVSEDDLAEFLELAGLVPSKDQARNHPAWQSWVPHRTALSWSSEQADRPDREVAELAGIRCPVLLVHGTVTADWLKRVVAVLDERLPDTRVLELPGDHACHLENQDAFLTALERHVAS
ncbi:alpha/beta fold hydrolase [Kitasatospora paracochleata]|uniref:Pimeloyl-ACP methyl ester carboxylesterase n=1 Tax=Kitasatospora paracochleata TaxID=58354 RepID=A0ABT1J251_9ACTN|nr:alpha/beta hydrolase [Kitasatospora paracochleata]MCP2311507.1 pimeloyl-ACP methyl ester carboxylesterase [Kitasatospora paracochleata]